MFQSIFFDNEIACAEKFDLLCTDEIELFHKLFDQLKNFVLQINNKIYDTDRPRYTIEILLVNNLTLFASSFNELRSGYLGVSQLVLRPTAENLTLSMYYWEFPEHEKKYRDNTKPLWNSIKTKGYKGE